MELETNIESNTEKNKNKILKYLLMPCLIIICYKLNEKRLLSDAISGILKSFPLSLPQRGTVTFIDNTNT